MVFPDPLVHQELQELPEPQVLPDSQDQAIMAMPLQPPFQALPVPLEHQDLLVQ